MTTYRTTDEAAAAAIGEIEEMRRKGSKTMTTPTYGGGLMDAAQVIRKHLALVATPSAEPVVCTDCLGIGEHIDICVHCGRDYAKERREKPAPAGDAGTVIDRIRAIARELGWAIGVHGSLTRDIDLIGVPWTAEAASWRDLYAALIARVPLDDAEGSVLGLHRGPHGRIKTLALQPHCEKASEHPKGHWSPPAIDLSIVDTRAEGSP